ncbi:Hypothetical protein FSTVST1_435 [Faustovirus ST1]|nr:Hypothetical protein FSTVST1_435 [Faustovirus ST1]
MITLEHLITLNYTMGEVTYQESYTLGCGKVMIIVTAVLTALFAVGVTVSFVLLTDARVQNPEKLCHLTPGVCDDKLVDGYVYATFNVNVTIDGCEGHEIVEMYRDINCAKLNKTDIMTTWLRYGESYGELMDMGAVACRVQPDNRCKWDHGEFYQATEIPLTATGVTMATLCAAALIGLLVSLCSEYCCQRNHC